ncbi:urea carboxylase-associated family protein (plasmid) [Phyllobacterium sp. A18/5-2]|uniref:urea carboxylase-associated family protein n=1 Tax=Phyllobacterium sp. A18/5-2 TaxID=2978392 RepID=UPI0021C9B206|nr:urea carboxylase-associated family protein [Phyllobacterium sp. A18/5-2]UXN67389.1 urea carboxylase-associated family protein [Phyllobacterium sp. A18/5-2]
MNQITQTDPADAILIPARRGVAAYVQAGQTVTVINTHGSQVVDTWAYNAKDMGEFMSMEHTRAAILTLLPKEGDVFTTNKRQPILTVVEDTTPGIHDTLIAACDCHRYRQLGAVGYHDNCTDNLHQALEAIALESTATPSPLNLFMNVPVENDGTLSFLPPVSKPGQFISLRAEQDIVIVLSACPQDMVPVNNMIPTEAHFKIR